MPEVTYGTGKDTSPQELADFYARLDHQVEGPPDQIRKMLANSAVFVTARVDDQLIGIARGVFDGMRAYFTECKLDPRFQGPGAVTRTDGRVEHDTYGIAREMAQRVLEKLSQSGAKRVDVLAWGTEVDFLEELGFKRHGGLVGMTMRPGTLAAQTSQKAAGMVN